MEPVVVHLVEQCAQETQKLPVEKVEPVTRMLPEVVAPQEQQAEVQEPTVLMVTRLLPDPVVVVVVVIQPVPVEPVVMAELPAEVAEAAVVERPLVEPEVTEVMAVYG